MIELLDTVAIGDVVSAAAALNGIVSVERATPTALATDYLGYGIVTAAGTRGTPGVVQTFTTPGNGIPAATTGLASNANGSLRIGANAKLELVSALAPGDYPAGSVVNGVTYLDFRTRVVSGGATDPNDLVILPGANRAAATNAAIVVANAAWLVDGIQRTVRYLAGRYEWETAVLLKSGVALVGADDWHTRVFWTGATPSVGLADDPTNAPMLARATIAGSDFTTTTATCYTDETTLTTSAAPTVGAWYLLRSTSAQAGYDGFNFGVDIVRGEPVRVKTVTGSGPYTVTLYSPIEQVHGSGSGLRVMTPLERVTVRGIDFRHEGGAHAAGLFAEGVLDLHVDLAGAGFSRGPLSGRYCHTITGRVHNRGENNSPVDLVSCHNTSVIHTYDPLTTLAFAHANGIPRGVHFAGACMRTRILGAIGHCVGLEIKGACEAVLDVSLEHCDFTERSNRDPNLFVGAGGAKVGGVLMNCSNPSSSENEVPYSVSGKVRLLDCRVPDPSTNTLQFGALFTDTVKFDFESIEFVNDGKNPNTSGSKCIGLGLYDTAAYDSIRFQRLSFIGIEAAITLYGGGNRAEFGRVEYTANAALFSGSVFLNFGHSAAGIYPVRIRHLVMNDQPGHFAADHAGTTGVNHDSLRDIVIDKLEITNGGTYEDVRFCLDVSGLADYAGQAGDVSEICPPRACTLVNATDTFALTGHDMPAGTPGHLGGTELPTASGGYNAGDILYVIASGLTANDFKLSRTLGGATVDWTSNGTALTFAPSYRTVRAATGGASFDKGAKVNGVGFGLGVAVPVRHYAVAFGKKKLVRMGAVQVLNGDRVKATPATLTGTVDNASTDPLGFARGKPSAAAGTVQVDK